MVVHGREVSFFRSVWADCEINTWAQGDMSKIDQFLQADYVTSQTACAKIMAILSEGSEQAKKYEDPEYVKRPLTEAEALTLAPADFSALFTEAMQAWLGEKPTIEAVPVKKTVKKAAAK